MNEILALRNLAADPFHDLPLFDLTADVINAIGQRDRETLLEDMREAGLLHLPFPVMAVRFPQNAVGDLFQTSKTDPCTLVTTIYIGGEVELRRKHYRTKQACPAKISTLMMFEFRGDIPRLIDITQANWGDRGDRQVFAELMTYSCEAVGILLLSLWAKDTIKRPASVRPWLRRTKRDAERKPGPTIISCTRIELPATIADDADNPATDATTRVPHLRRGHPHTVLSGPGRTVRTSKWFAPTWVGVDIAYAKSRRYRVVP